MKNGIEIILDRPRIMKYGIGSMLEIEKKYNTDDTSKMSLETLIELWLLGLKKDDPQLTKEQLVELVDEYSSMQDMSKAMSDAMALFNGGEVKNG